MKGDVFTLASNSSTLASTDSAALSIEDNEITIATTDRPSMPDAARSDTISIGVEEMKNDKIASKQHAAGWEGTKLIFWTDAPPPA